MSDRHWSPAATPLPPGWQRARGKRTSTYLTMRDGVRIAVDVVLPEGGAGRLPAILRQTRYLRTLEPRLPGLGRTVADAFDLYLRTRQVFLAAGYAWVDVDVRGSGASSGTRPYPWSMAEILDGGELVSWIVAQPWSSGKVGSLGISYDGTCAEMLLVNQHPAVVAVAPTFACFDAYLDVAFPGGIQLAWFTEVWASYNAALDRGSFPEGFAKVVRAIVRAAGASPTPHGMDRLLAPLAHLGAAPFERATAALLGRLLAGVAPVGGEAGRAELARAVAEHAANVSVHEGANKIIFRDDAGLSLVAPESTIDVLSPHTYAARTSGAAAVYSYSGHRDGAYPRGAINRHATLDAPGSRLTIGPWLHSGKLRIRPFDTAVPADFDHDAELLGFFDEHVRGRPPAGDGKPVHYYTFVEERWKAADRWPPPFEPRVLHLAPGRRLAAEAPEVAGDDSVRVDPALGTGERSRWRSLFSLVPGDYPDRRERDRHLLVFDSEPLPRALEVTGHPVVTLFASWDDDDDGRLFAYLEDVAPDGRVAYVTEGQLRALHRRTLSPPEPGAVPQRSFRRAGASPLPRGVVGELAFELLPISWRYERGHRLRLALAGGDADHFARSRPSTLRLHRSPAQPSRLTLPIVG